MDDDRAIVPEALARHILSGGRTRLRKRWYRAPPRQPKQRKPKPKRRPYARWTDTDDGVVIAFPPAEASAILGRTLASVYMRRSKLDVSMPISTRQPRARLRREYFQKDGCPLSPPSQSTTKILATYRLCLVHSRRWPEWWDAVGQP